MILSKFTPDFKEKWTFFSIERTCLQTNAVELSKWLTDAALVNDQLIAKQSHEPKGAAETRKLNHIHQTKA